jgi:hypothetical protein
MWDWLARHPRSNKYTYCKMIRVNPDANCFACDYVNDVYGRGDDCNKCPMQECWGGRRCCAIESPYFKWDTSLCYIKNRRDSARTIANYCTKKIKELSAAQLNIT